MKIVSFAHSKGKRNKRGWDSLTVQSLKQKKGPPPFPFQKTLTLFSGLIGWNPKFPTDEPAHFCAALLPRLRDTRKSRRWLFYTNLPLHLLSILLGGPFSPSTKLLIILKDTV